MLTAASITHHDQCPTIFWFVDGVGSMVLVIRQPRGYSLQDHTGLYECLDMDEHNLSDSESGGRLQVSPTLKRRNRCYHLVSSMDKRSNLSWSHWNDCCACSWVITIACFAHSSTISLAFTAHLTHLLATASLQLYNDTSTVTNVLGLILWETRTPSTKEL